MLVVYHELCGCAASRVSSLSVLTYVSGRCVCIMPARAMKITSKAVMRTDAKTKASPAPWKKLSTEEMRLAKTWYEEDDKNPSEIAKLLHRDKSTLTRLLVMQTPRKPDGRKPDLSKEKVAMLVKLLDKLVLKANAKYEVISLHPKRIGLC
jgi:hypothetical protein